MTSTISANRRYFWLFLTPIAIFAAAIGLSLLFLYRGGELTEIKAIAAAQQLNGGLYGTALHYDVYT